MVPKISYWHIATVSVCIRKTGSWEAEIRRGRGETKSKATVPSSVSPHPRPVFLFLYGLIVHYFRLLPNRFHMDDLVNLLN